MKQTENAVVLNGSKHRDPDSDQLTNGNETGGHHDKDGDDCSDCLVQQKLHHGADPEADGDGGDGAVTFSRPEAIWRKTFLTTRMTLGSLNLISLCLKFPLIILIIRMVLDIAKAKATESQVVTIEPPYEDEVPQPVSSGDSDSKSQKRESVFHSLATDRPPACLPIDTSPIVTSLLFSDDRGLCRADRPAARHVRGNSAGSRAVRLFLLDE